MESGPGIHPGSLERIRQETTPKSQGGEAKRLYALDISPSNIYARSRRSGARRSISAPGVIMVVVRDPFCSVWASGTVGKTLTCRAMGGPFFVMAKYISQRKRKSPRQLEQQRIFQRKIIIDKHYWELAKAHSGISGLMASNFGISGAGEPIFTHMTVLPRWMWITNPPPPWGK